MAWRAGTTSGPSSGWRAGTDTWESWIAGVTGTGAATESGSDTASGSGVYNPTNVLTQYGIDPATIQTGPDSLGSQLTGSAAAGDKWLLPTVYADGTITWEVDSNGNATGRIATMTGSGDATNLPWRYWNGAAWLSATFSTRGSTQTNAGSGAATESPDTAAGSGTVEIVGGGDAIEGEDTAGITGTVNVIGAGAATESGADTLAGVASISDITLTRSSVRIDAGVNALVGYLQSPSGTESFVLVAGTGDTDNASFSISGNQLLCDDPSALGLGVRTIRVQSSSGFSKALLITVVSAIIGGEVRSAVRSSILSSVYSSARRAVR